MVYFHQLCAIDCEVPLPDFQVQQLVVLISLPCGGLHVRQWQYGLESTCLKSQNVINGKSVRSQIYIYNKCVSS